MIKKLTYPKVLLFDCFETIIENDILVDSTKKNEEVILIFDKTPFYAEAGGQLGDSGNIYNSKRQIVAEISDTKKIKNGIYLHFVNRCLLELKKNESYFLEFHAYLLRG